jgi:hypothetical protein
MGDPAPLDPIETAFKTGAAAALRRRADRQARLANDGGGEGAIAGRLAATLLDLAAELEAELPADATSCSPKASYEQDGLLRSAGGVEWLPRQGGEAPAPSWPQPELNR